MSSATAAVPSQPHPPTSGTKRARDGRGRSSFRTEAVAARRANRGETPKTARGSSAARRDGPSCETAHAITPIRVDNIVANDGYRGGPVDTWPGKQPRPIQSMPANLPLTPRLQSLRPESSVALVAPELSSRYTRGNPRVLAQLQKRVAGAIATASKTDERIQILKECWDELADHLVSCCAHSHTFAQ